MLFFKIQYEGGTLKGPPFFMENVSEKNKLFGKRGIYAIEVQVKIETDLV